MHIRVVLCVSWICLGLNLRLLDYWRKKAKFIIVVVACEVDKATFKFAYMFY